jgi:hypothetical protein
MIYMRGLIPDDDDNFLRVVETIGKYMEEYTWLITEYTSTETKPNTNIRDINTNKEQENKTENKKD